MVNQQTRIYLDNAATTRLDPEVIKAMTEAMHNNYGNPSSIHALGRKSRILIEQSRKTIANTLNTSLGEIFFTSSATESNNAVFRAAIRDLDIKRVITSKSEHHCVLNSIKSIADIVEVIYLDLDKNGNIDLEQLKNAMGSKGKKTLVSLMHVNNEIGTILDLKSVALICQEMDAYFHTDAVQSVGKLELDLQDTPVHFLSGTAHKINGPKGCGFLYINSDTNIGPIMYGGSQERNMRAGTENLYGIVGLGRTLELWVENREKRIANIQSSKNAFKEILLESDKDIDFLGNQDERGAPHILSVGFPKSATSEMIMMNLDIQGVCASAGSACSSGSQSDSHVLSAINYPNSRKVVRFSFSYMTTVDEAQEAAKRFLSII